MCIRWRWSLVCNAVRAEARPAIEGFGGSKLECVRNLDAERTIARITNRSRHDISRRRTMDKNVRLISSNRRTSRETNFISAIIFKNHTILFICAPLLCLKLHCLPLELVVTCDQDNSARKFFLTYIIRFFLSQIRRVKYR